MAEVERRQAIVPMQYARTAFTALALMAAVINIVGSALIAKQPNPVFAGNQAANILRVIGAGICAVNAMLVAPSLARLTMTSYAAYKSSFYQAANWWPTLLILSSLFEVASGAMALLQHAGKSTTFSPSRLWTLAVVTQLLGWICKTYSDVPKLSDVFRALGIPVDVPGARDRHHAGWHWFRAVAAIAGNLLMVACPVLLSVMAFASTWPRAGNVLSIIAQSLMAGGSLATLGAVTTPEKPLQRLVAMMPTFS